MSSDRAVDRDGVVDLGTYCRLIEAHLTQVNGGHLVRIVGPSFEVVRRWAADAVPLAIVRRGIDRKAERHGRGAATRPLRLEFCEADVRAVFDEWRRAIGVPTAALVTDGGGDERAARKRPSLARHLDRVLDRLGAVTGRLDLAEQFRDRLEALRDQVAAVKDASHGARGEARDAYVARLTDLDRELLELARRFTSDEVWRRLHDDAEADLAAYRGRLAAGDWQQSVEITAVRLLRDHLGLPTIELLT
ncbi:MAG TPA: hypothetical protein VMM93_00650 [Vicinamibacterales bacterium]|nr:hypothetical protein [Vicinamibacterales bacterium]